MGEDYLHGLMVDNMKGNIKTIKKKGMENLHGVMEDSI